MNWAAFDEWRLNLGRELMGKHPDLFSENVGTIVEDIATFLASYASLKKGHSICEMTDAGGLAELIAAPWTEGTVLRPRWEVIECLQHLDASALKELFGEHGIFAENDVLGTIHMLCARRPLIRHEPSGEVRMDRRGNQQKTGMFYTPNHIVDWMVRRSLTPLITGVAPHQLRELCILDPACGSGRFLVSAYRVLLDHYQDWYRSHPEVLPEFPMVQGSDGLLYLHPQERSCIALRHLYGIDIDGKAVQLARTAV